MTIHGLRYFNNEGLEGYFDTPDDPYYLGDRQSRIGNMLFNSNIGVRWYHYIDEKKQGVVEVKFDLGCRALIDTSRCFVIVIGERRPMISWPRNAVVLKEDGSVDHIIELPSISYDFGDGPRPVPPEGFRNVYQKDCDVVLSVYFNFEWFQDRTYDLMTRQWGRIVGTGRA